MAKHPQVTLPEGRRHCDKCKGIGHRGPKINARSKGQRGEREVVKILQVVVDKVHHSRGLQPIIIQRNQLQSHLGGEDLHGLPGFAVEVKFCETLNLKSWWEQCLRQATKVAAQPILIYRRSNEDWTVRWRCYISTPKEQDLIELDVEAPVDEFLTWFEAAYIESLGPVEIPATPELVAEVKAIWEKPPQLTKEDLSYPQPQHPHYSPPMCVCHTGAGWCPECHG